MEAKRQVARRGPKRYFKRKAYKPTVARPFGSLYDNDYYLRVNIIKPVLVDQSAAFHMMRTDQGASGNIMTSHWDQPEFNAIKNSFQTYSVVGMKMKVTIQVY